MKENDNDQKSGLCFKKNESKKFKYKRKGSSQQDFLTVHS